MIRALSLPSRLFKDDCVGGGGGGDGEEDGRSGVSYCSAADEYDGVMLQDLVAKLIVIKTSFAHLRSLRSRWTTSDPSVVVDTNVLQRANEGEHHKSAAKGEDGVKALQREDAQSRYGSCGHRPASS